MVYGASAKSESMEAFVPFVKLASEHSAPAVSIFPPPKSTPVCRAKNEENKKKIQSRLSSLLKKLFGGNTCHISFHFLP